MGDPAGEAVLQKVTVGHAGAHFLSRRQVSAIHRPLEFQVTPTVCEIYESGFGLDGALLGEPPAAIDGKHTRGEAIRRALVGHRPFDDARGCDKEGRKGRCLGRQVEHHPSVMGGSCAIESAQHWA